MVRALQAHGRRAHRAALANLETGARAAGGSVTSTRSGWRSFGAAGLHAIPAASDSAVAVLQLQLLRLADG